MPEKAGELDDDCFYKADSGELGRNDAVSPVLYVVASTKTGAEDNAHHCAPRLVVVTHLSNLLCILTQDALHGLLGYKDLRKRNEKNRLFAHDGSLPGTQATQAACLRSGFPTWEPCSKHDRSRLPPWLSRVVPQPQ
jgi:hypothetical protein